MAIRSKNVDSEREEAPEEAPDTPQSQYVDIHGIPTEEEALAAVATHNEEGAVVSDGMREQTAAKIIEAAQCNRSWRQTLPYEQQLALRDVPVVSAPPIEADGAAV